MEKTLTPNTIAMYLGKGFILLLISFSLFSICDLYRRFKNIEEVVQKIIAIEVNVNRNSATLDSMAISLQELNDTKSDGD